MLTSFSVIPPKAGIHLLVGVHGQSQEMGSRFRGNDDASVLGGSL